MCSMCSNRQLYSQLALTGLNAFVYTGLNAQKHRSLIGANNYGWCFEYDGFNAGDADDSDDHEDSYYQAQHRQVARWLQRWRGLFEPFSACPPGARSSSYQ